MQDLGSLVDTRGHTTQFRTEYKRPLQGSPERTRKEKKTRAVSTLDGMQYSAEFAGALYCTVDDYYPIWPNDKPTSV